MDFFSHIFWTWAIFKTIEKKTKKQLNTKLAIFWGVFPDLFAFVIPIVLVMFDIITGKADYSNFPRPETLEPAEQNTVPAFRLLSLLYSISHSFVIFLIILAVISVFIFIARRASEAGKNFRVPWELASWPLHILIDIPTHSTQFYSTPFLWPISDFKINGISWSTPWFLELNYLIIFIIILLYLLKRKFSK